MSDLTLHARLSPSGAPRWMSCPGSVALEAGLPEWDTGYADEGTAAHSLSALCLNEGKDALAYLGRIFEVQGYDKGERVTREFEVDEDMAGHVQDYLDEIRAYAMGHEMLVEQRVPIDHLTGEEGAEGTSDVVIITSDGEELQIHDLKFGRGVRVDAEDNGQLKMYALGALKRFAVMGDFKRVRLVIHQPRLEHLSEWVCPVGHLEEFKREIADAALTVATATEFKANWVNSPNNAYLVPSDKACQFCKAKAICPTLAARVQADVGADFEDLTAESDNPERGDEGDIPSRMLPTDPAQLAAKMRAIDLIEDWCKAVRAQVERELFNGRPVPGYKLVQGKRGNRAWSDPTAAEDLLRKQFRLTIEDAFNLKLKSPTQVEALLKKEHPRRWEKAQTLVSQAEGKASVAPESDKRPALVVTPTEDDFADLNVPEALV